ncbi:MAG: small multi-drug export protein [Deltaproteobacteria bacterium]|nr:small multi-drug export protein [Deltaproteobacteria bacterium]
MSFLKKITSWRHAVAPVLPPDENSAVSEGPVVKTAENSPDAKAQEPEGGVGTALYRSGEGRVFLLGLFLSLVFIALIAYALTLDIKTGQTLLLAFVAHTLGGRAAGIGICIAFKFSPWVTIAYNMFLEVLIVCYCYSLFVFSFKNYLKCRWLTIVTGNAEKQALKHKKNVARYGWLGIFAFVMVPLPITGPVAGSIIAYFLKFSIKRNFSAVFSGTLAAIIIWAYFFDYLDRHIAVFKYVVMAALLFFFLSYFKTIKKWFTQEIAIQEVEEVEAVEESEE